MAKINQEKMKRAFSSRQFKMGMFQTILTVIVIAVIVILNMLVSKMNIMVDLSSDKKYSLTEESIMLVKELKDKVSLFYMYEEGSDVSDNNDIVKKVLDQYDSVGSNIALSSKDPQKLPQFATQYTDGKVKSEDVRSKDVIVVNETTKKVKHISAQDMVLEEQDPYSGAVIPKTLDVEGQVTAAIQSVTSEDSKTLYATTGHSEAALSASLSDILTKSNMIIESTRTDAKEGIPKDCDILMINAPMYDFSEFDMPNIQAYFENGGKALIFLYPKMEESAFPNLCKILNQYGLKLNPGYVFETTDHYLGRSPLEVNGMMNSHEITAEVTADKDIPFPLTKGMTMLNETRSTLTVEPLVSSSEESFSKMPVDNSDLEKKEGDVSGPFTLGAAVTDEYKDKKAQLIVFGTANVAADSNIMDGRYGNRSIVLNSVAWLNGRENSMLAIPQRSLENPTVDVPSDSRGMISFLLIGLLPAAILGFGFFIWYRRRKS